MKREFKKVLNQIDREEQKLTLETNKVISESLEMVKYLNSILFNFLIFTYFDYDVLLVK